MKTFHASSHVHPPGESRNPPSLASPPPIPVDTYGGRIHVEWDPQAAVTPLGQLPFFIEFLKTAELFAPWVRECPLTYQSPNAPQPVDVLGTILLSVLSGHHRSAHLTTIRTDGVNPTLLGMSNVCSEDSVRRALRALTEPASTQWLKTHLLRCYEPLLTEPWILDVEVTAKSLYGHQEGAEVGYNPHKPGCPSHTYFIGNLRLALDVEVRPGKQQPTGSRTCLSSNKPNGARGSLRNSLPTPSGSVRGKAGRGWTRRCSYRAGPRLAGWSSYGVV